MHAGTHQVRRGDQCQDGHGEQRDQDRRQQCRGRRNAGQQHQTDQPGPGDPTEHRVVQHAAADQEQRRSAEDDRSPGGRRLSEGTRHDEMAGDRHSADAGHHDQMSDRGRLREQRRVRRPRDGVGQQLPGPVDVDPPGQHHDHEHHQEGPGPVHRVLVQAEGRPGHEDGRAERDDDELPVPLGHPPADQPPLLRGGPTEPRHGPAERGGDVLDADGRRPEHQAGGAGGQPAADPADCGDGVPEQDPAAAAGLSRSRPEQEVVAARPEVDGQVGDREEQAPLAIRVRRRCCQQQAGGRHPDELHLDRGPSQVEGVRGPRGQRPDQDEREQQDHGLPDAGPGQIDGERLDQGDQRKDVGQIEEELEERRPPRIQLGRGRRTGAAFRCHRHPPDRPHRPRLPIRSPA